MYRNLYLPKKPRAACRRSSSCGHGQVKRTGQLRQQGALPAPRGWFARNGYACLTIDTLQLGEIEGIHHGTYRYAKWWWNARGYSPAGVEAWNCIRAWITCRQARD
ncbi:MAG: hypothetical protein CM1200mP2_31770 [Planctomycetaceae bacterium]|nr:MAG: hypothetical protein CM1200mP2_31770 [Planctomycetaceae bacterium]